MSEETTSDAPPEVAPEITRTASTIGLRIGGDGGVRSDVGGIECPGEQGLHGGRAGVEQAGLEGVLPELLGEDPVLDPDDGGGVGQVREIAEADGGRGLGGGAVRARGVGGPAAGRSTHREQGDETQCGDGTQSGHRGPFNTKYFDRNTGNMERRQTREQQLPKSE